MVPIMSFAVFNCNFLTWTMKYFYQSTLECIYVNTKSYLRGNRIQLTSKIIAKDIVNVSSSTDCVEFIIIKSWIVRHHHKNRTLFDPLYLKDVWPCSPNSSDKLLHTLFDISSFRVTRLVHPENLNHLSDQTINPYLWARQFDHEVHFTFLILKSFNKTLSCAHIQLKDNSE